MEFRALRQRAIIVNHRTQAHNGAIPKFNFRTDTQLHKFVICVIVVCVFVIYHPKICLFHISESLNILPWRVATSSPPSSRKNNNHIVIRSSDRDPIVGFPSSPVTFSSEFVSMKMIILIYNLRARLVGINQIRNFFMPALNQNAEQYM